jgi:hypothetical protein
LRSRPDFEKESQRFRIELRNNDFLNPSKNIPVFQSLDGNKLSEAMKLFSSTACNRRQDYIKGKLSLNKSSEKFHPIPVTLEEEEKQSAANSLTKDELLHVIETLIGSLNETDRPQFRGLRTKSKTHLLSIFQKVQDLHNGNDIDELE